MAWTHRERLLAALNHEEADRVPMDFGSASPTAITMDAYQGLVDHLGVDSEVEYLSAMNQVVYPAEEVLRRFDIDTRGVIAGRYKGGHQKVVDDVTRIDEFGVTWKRPVGTATKHSLHVDGPFHDIAPDIDAIEGFAWPDPDNEGVVADLRARVDAIKAAGDHAIVLYLPGGVIHRGYAMRGFERYLKDLYKAPAFVTRLMDKLCDYWVAVAERAIDEAGPENIDVVFFGEDLGTQEGAMFDPELYARMIKPRHRRMAEAVKSRSNAKICFHCCGSAYRFIDHLIDIGVDALNPVQVTAANMEPERLKADFGDRISFWGGINTQVILPGGTPAEVTAETRRIIDILGRDGGYVLNAVHNIQPEVPPENIIAMFDAGLGYPYGEKAA